MAAAVAFMGVTRTSSPHYEEFAPPPALAAHVHCLWLFEGEEAGVEQAAPPTAAPELIVHVGTAV